MERVAIPLAVSIFPASVGASGATGTLDQALEPTKSTSYCSTFRAFDGFVPGISTDPEGPAFAAEITETLTQLGIFIDSRSLGSGRLIVQITSSSGAMLGGTTASADKNARYGRRADHCRVGRGCSACHRPLSFRSEHEICFVV